MPRALVNARVFTMQQPDSESDAVAWDERIVCLGDAAVRAWAADQGIEVEDMQGRVVLPGFVDAHMHFLHIGVKRTRPDLRGAKTKGEALQRVADYLATNPGPVIGEGWDEAEWEPRQVPTRDELDALSDAPLVVRRICGHKAVANSAALPLIRARWDDERVDMETGILLEEPSLYLNEVMPTDDATLDAAVLESCRVAHAIGVTSLNDYEQAPFRAALMRAAASGDLSVRVQCSIYAQFLEEAIAEGFRTGRPITSEGEDPDSLLRDGGLKVFHDGSLGGYTAYMLEPYLDRPTRGRAIWTDAEVDDLYQTAHDAGIQIQAHAIGDAAVEQALQGFERLADRVGPAPSSEAGGQAATTSDERPDATERPGPAGAHAMRCAEALQIGAVRPRIEHYEIVHDDQVARTAALGVWASSQPNFVGAWSAKGGMYEERIGERFHLNNRFQTFRKAGVRIAFGSDGMPFGPLYGIQSTREHPREEERLDAATAVWHYTCEAAASMGRDDIGRLLPGCHADVLILDQADLEADARTWTIRETIVAGETRHRGERPYVSDDDVPPMS